MDYRVPFHPTGYVADSPTHRRAPSARPLHPVLNPNRKTPDFDEQLLERRRKEMDKARERNARVRYDESNGYTAVYPSTGRQTRREQLCADDAAMARRLRESNGHATVYPPTDHQMRREQLCAHDAAMARRLHEQFRESNGHATVYPSTDHRMRREQLCADDAAMARRLHEQFREGNGHATVYPSTDHQVRREPLCADDAAVARKLHEQFSREQMDSLAEQARGLHVGQTSLEKSIGGNAARHHTYKSALDENTQQTAERVHLNRTLRENGLCEKPIKGDGNCQFRAVADQLWGDEDKYYTVKQCAIHDLETNHRRDPEFMWPTSEHDGYIDRLKRNGTYGDDLTLHAIANDMGIRIIVISDFAQENVKCVYPEDENRITDTIVLGYWGEGRGDHYTSIVEMPGRQCA